MNKVKQPTPSTQDPRALYEDIELGVYQSTNVKELEQAYKSFLTLSDFDQKNVVMFAGPARIVALALRGYELPDAPMRQQSSSFVLGLNQLFESTSSIVTAEQFWLMIAQQREILLERIEADLEALQRSSLSEEATKQQVTTLGTLHKLIRKKSVQATASIFATELVPASSLS